MKRDDIFLLPQNKIGDFTFDAQVADVFPDMISRSIPGYGSVLSMIGLLTDRFAKPATNLYDLGCSLGAATRLMCASAPSDCVIFAIDNSSAMVERLREQMKGWEAQSTLSSKRVPQVIVQEADVCRIQKSNASFIVLNWTLQFIEQSSRVGLLRDIYEAMVPGGALLMSEKIRMSDAAEQELLFELHHDFKRANGYSDLEISQKRTALENRLIPETIETHLQRLTEVGFETATVWFQCFNFASLLAIKSQSEIGTERFDHSQGSDVFSNRR